MKLFYQKDGISTVYIQKKDLKLYPKFRSYIETEWEDASEDTFIPFVDIDMVDFFSKDMLVLDYHENMNYSIGELQRKVRQLALGNDAIPAHFLYNQIEDLSAICSFKLGNIELPLPLLEDFNGPYFANNSYKIRTLIDPFKVSIRKVTDDDFQENELLPNKIIDQSTIYTKRKLGFTDTLPYDYTIVPSEDRKQTILDIRFQNYEQLMVSLEPPVVVEDEILPLKTPVKQKLRNFLQQIILKKD